MPCLATMRRAWRAWRALEGEPASRSVWPQPRQTRRWMPAGCGFLCPSPAPDCLAHTHSPSRILSLIPTLHNRISFTVLCCTTRVRPVQRARPVQRDSATPFAITRRWPCATAAWQWPDPSDKHGSRRQLVSADPPWIIQRQGSSAFRLLSRHRPDSSKWALARTLGGSAALVHCTAYWPSGSSEGRNRVHECGHASKGRLTSPPHSLTRSHTRRPMPHWPHCPHCPLLVRRL
ncbi:hypothetical protein BC831DRAFT_19091 [Entophlyctis helioformis]|nr:hypothetical protein BC831DRAFT_19091 [Entophlyctis helioformis]